MTPLTEGHTPALMHSQNTNTVTATAEKMTAPSLILREQTVSSGRRGLTIAPRRRPCGGDGDVVGRVPDAVDGADDVGTELATHGTNVRVDRPRARPVVVAPHLHQQLPAREHLARVRSEVGEQVELGGREVHGVVAAGGRAGWRGRARPPATCSVPPVLGGRGAGALDAAQQRVHPGDELAGAERLRQVVVGADGQPDDHVGLRVAGRQHQHRHGAVVLDAPAHLEPVEAGQHQVEHDEIGVNPLAHLDAAGAVGRDLDDEPLTAEPRRDRLRDRRFVFDDDDRAGRGGGRRSRGHRTPG